MWKKWLFLPLTSFLEVKIWSKELTSILSLLSFLILHILTPILSIYHILVMKYDSYKNHSYFGKGQWPLTSDKKVSPTPISPSFFLVVVHTHTYQNQLKLASFKFFHRLAQYMANLGLLFTIPWHCTVHRFTWWWCLGGAQTFFHHLLKCYLF